MVSSSSGVTPATGEQVEGSSGVTPAAVLPSGQAVTSPRDDASMGETAVESEPSVNVVYQASDRASDAADVANIEASFLPQTQADILIKEFEAAVGVKFPPLEAVVTVVVSWASLLKYVATSNAPAAARESRHLKSLIREHICIWLRERN